MFSFVIPMKMGIWFTLSWEFQIPAQKTAGMTVGGLGCLILPRSNLTPPDLGKSPNHR